MRSSRAPISCVCALLVAVCGGALGGEPRPPEKRDLEALIEGLKDKDAKKRRAALWELAEFNRRDVTAAAKKLAPLLTPFLGEEDGKVRDLARDMLWDMEAVAVPLLVRTLEGGNTLARFEVARFLGDLRAKAESALPALKKAFADKERKVRAAAVMAVYDILYGIKRSKAGPVDGLADPDPVVRRACAEALGLAGWKKKKTAAVLVKLLKDKDASVRAAAAYGLCGFGGGKIDHTAAIAGMAVPALLKAFSDKEATVRADAVAALGEGNFLLLANKPAQRAIAGMLKDKNGLVRAAAAGAVHGMEVEDLGINLLPQLMALLKDKEPKVRAAAALALPELREEAEKAVPQLIAALKDKDAKVRWAAVRALSEIGEGKGIVEALGRALSDKDEAVRLEAAERLDEFLGETRRAMAALIKATGDDNREVRAASIWALSVFIGPGDTGAVLPALRKRLGDEYDYARRLAAEAVGKLGPKAREAVPALKKLAKEDKDRGVRAAAVKALRKIKG